MFCNVLRLKGEMKMADKKGKKPSGFDYVGLPTPQVIEKPIVGASVCSPDNKVKPKIQPDGDFGNIPVPPPSKPIKEKLKVK